jgi:hypothetical protein
MFRFKYCFIAATVALVAMFGTVRAVNAGSMVYFSSNNGTTWTALAESGGPGSGFFSGSGFIVTVVPSEGAGTAQLFSTQIKGINLAGTYQLLIASNDFASPLVTPISITTSTAPTSLPGTGTVQTFVAQGDKTGNSGGPSFTPVVLSAPDVISGGPLSQGLGSQGPPPMGTTAHGTITSNLPGTPTFTTYTVAQELTVTLPHGGATNLTITTTLNPEPATMTMVGIGIVCMGGYALRRRKLAKVAS